MDFHEQPTDEIPVLQPTLEMPAVHRPNPALDQIQASATYAAARPLPAEPVNKPWHMMTWREKRQQKRWRRMMKREVAHLSRAERTEAKRWFWSDWDPNAGVQPAFPMVSPTDFNQMHRDRW